MQGIFSPDREPHPGAFELKKLQEPVGLTYQNKDSPIEIKLNSDAKTATPLTINVKNRYDFRDLSHLKWNFSVETDAATDGFGPFSFDPKIGSLVGHGTSTFTLSLDEIIDDVVQLQKSCPDPLELWLNISGSLKEEQMWAPADHELVSVQFPLRIVGLDEYISEPIPTNTIVTEQGGAIETTHKDTNLTFQSDDRFCRVCTGDNSTLWALFDKKTGSLRALRNADGTKVISDLDDPASDAPGIEPNYTRAHTDNDRGGADLLLAFILPALLRFLNPLIYFGYSVIQGSGDFSYYLHWRRIGLMPNKQPSFVCRGIVMKNGENGSVVVTVSSDSVSTSSSTVLIKQKMVYTFYKDRKISIHHQVYPQRPVQSLPCLPRVGLSLPLSKDLFNMRYYGRGPIENYPDRKACAKMGVFQTTAKDNEFDYIVPSENGNKTDCRWAAYHTNDGRGIVVVTDKDCPSMNAGVSLNQQHELHSALHTVDLKERRNGDTPVYATIDHKMLGVGGDVR